MKKIPGMRNLSRRERQIMDVLYRLGRATVTEVMEQLPEDRGNSTIRKQMNILEEKGFIRHTTEKNYNIYFPALEAEKASTSAMQHLLNTFFHGSVAQAFLSLVKVSEGKLSEEEKKVITEMAVKAREDGR